MTHELKIAGRWYEKLLNGEKTFELRNNDRNFQVGHTLKFIVLDDKQRERKSPIRWYITHMLKHDECVGLEPGYCVLSLQIFP